MTMADEIKEATPDLGAGTDVKQAMPVQQAALLDPRLKKDAAEGKPAPKAKPAGATEIHDIGDGYVVVYNGLAYGFKPDDLSGQLIRLMKGGDVVSYSGKDGKVEDWVNKAPIAIEQLQQITAHCMGIMVVHRLVNCYLVVGPAGMRLASTDGDVLAAMQAIFKKV
jgi:hypothetical protein